MVIFAGYLLMVAFFAFYATGEPASWANAAGRGWMVGLLVYLGFGALPAALTGAAVVWWWHPIKQGTPNA